MLKKKKKKKFSSQKTQNKQRGLSFRSLPVRVRDSPIGHLPSQLTIPPVIYLILTFTLQWSGLRDKETGDERMRDRERPGLWWLSVDGPMSVQRVVAGWTRLVEAKACLTSRIRATDTFLNLSTQSSGHTGCSTAGISKRVIQARIISIFQLYFRLPFRMSRKG